MAIKILMFACMLLSSFSLFSQAERKIIREGNTLYQQGNYAQAETEYSRAVRKNVNSFEAQFNLADALYKQERYDEAIDILDKLVQKESDQGNLAQLHYNIGNCYLKQNKFEKSVEEYKNSLRAKFDKEAQYNLSYALLKLKNQNNQDQQKKKKVFESLEKEEQKIQRKMRGERVNMPQVDKNW
jgi:Ca-activated chloride channel homolog